MLDGSPGGSPAWSPAWSPGGSAAIMLASDGLDGSPSPGGIPGTGSPGAPTGGPGGGGFSFSSGGDFSASLGLTLSGDVVCPSTEPSWGAGLGCCTCPGVGGRAPSCTGVADGVPGGP